jgi:O-antigen/teichoic acid export membrane protein
MPIPKSLYYIAGRFFMVIGQLVMIRVLTSTLNPLEIGKYYLLISLVSFPSLFFISPVLTFFSRHYYGWYRNGCGWAIFKKIMLFVFMVSSVCALILTMRRIFNLQHNKLDDLYFYIPLLITVGTISSYSQELLNIIGRSRTFILLNNLELWGKIGIITASLFFFPSIAMTVFGVITIWGVAFSLLCVYLLRTYTKDIQNAIEKKKSPVQSFEIRGIFNFAWPFAVTASLYWCQTDGYRFVLAYVSDMASVGKFVVGFGLGAALMSALDTLFHQLYLPRYYREISVGTIDSYTEAWNKYAQKVVGVFIPFSLFIACAAPYLARWLLDSNYWDTGVYATLGAISQLFRIFSGAFVNGVIAGKRTSVLILPSLAGAVIALVGTFMFATKSPLLGTGASMLLAYFAVCICLYFELSRQLHIQLPISAVVKALKVSAPICFVLLLLLKFGFSDVPLLNILTLLVTGSGLLYTQWVMSRDVWFTK